MADFDEDLSDQAVANLVTQFSSALDFYRELVQNSIDAGSSAIEIWLDYTPDESGGAGVIEIHVDDFGEGMTSEIIDDQLTTLFSSSKEGDLTKIGKFGIGFVSVFAIQPAGVLVQTGRDGEYWEVFFHADRSFDKSPLATPIEGTQITLFVSGDRARYTDLVARSRETLEHWCRHSEAEISERDRQAPVLAIDGRRAIPKCDVVEDRQGRENGRPDGVQASQGEQRGDDAEQLAAVLGHRRQVEVGVRGWRGVAVRFVRRNAYGCVRCRFAGAFVAGDLVAGVLAQQGQPAPDEPMQQDQTAGQPEAQEQGMHHDHRRVDVAVQGRGEDHKGRGDQGREP